jgi:NADPH-dependent ferric siderophore reductase
MNFPKIIKTVEVPHQNRFLVGPRIWTIQLIDVGDRIVAVDFWHHHSGALHSVVQRELRQEEQVFLT